MDTFATLVKTLHAVGMQLFMIGIPQSCIDTT